MGKKDLIDRWPTGDQYGLKVLPSGLQDCRGYPFAAKVQGAHFENADFQYAQAAHSVLEGCVFRHCSFVGADFSDSKDVRCTFEDCTFRRCDFRIAGIGIDGSSFQNCQFDECKFARASFHNPVFRGCSFNGKVKGVDFQASGLWDCSFEEAVEDVRFRGAFFPEPSVPVVAPKDVGLHRVDFTRAALRWITLSEGCEVVEVALPSTARLVNVRMVTPGILRLLEEEFGDGYRPLKELLDAMSVHSQEQQKMILTQGDLDDASVPDSGRVLEVLGGKISAELSLN